MTADLDKLDALAAAARPRPWIRKWESLDVHGIDGDGVFADQRSVDFAVALVNEWPTIRDLVAAARERDELRAAADAFLLSLDTGSDDLGPENRLRAALAASPAPEPTGLDAAWAEAEAALPEGWFIGVVSQYPYRPAEERWFAQAFDNEQDADYRVFRTGTGSDLLAALRALAARLAATDDRERTE